MALTAASMWTKRKAAIAAVPAVQSSDPSVIADYRDAVGIADCQAIIDEFVENSELVPVSTDSGPAGAGIITGSVK